MLKILIIEDHALVREGLVRLLARIESGVVLRDCADFDSALAVLEDEDEVDLVLLDLALPVSTSCAGSSRRCPSSWFRLSTMRRRSPG